MIHDLIFDIGMHDGTDTEFYLEKGFRVVAVDADQALCQQVARQHAQHIASGRLQIVNKAVAAQAGHVSLYRSSNSIWNTIDPTWRDQKAASADVLDTVTVAATTMTELVAEYGSPYYVKIDIEGMDIVALQGLVDVGERPKYVSIESSKTSLRELRSEFALLTSLGYDRFKISPQLGVQNQRPPTPPLEGKTAAQPKKGASGHFGEEAPGEWLTQSEAIEAYRPIFLRYALTGEDPCIRSRWVRAALKRLGFRAGWHDTHAKRSLG
jgi:FkbM family methyltransferase